MCALLDVVVQDWFESARLEAVIECHMTRKLGKTCAMRLSEKDFLHGSHVS